METGDMVADTSGHGAWWWCNVKYPVIYTCHTNTTGYVTALLSHYDIFYILNIIEQGQDSIQNKR